MTLLKVKTRPLDVNWRNSYTVLMRSQRPGPGFNEWAPISTSGFVVVCPSKLEASELVWMVGGAIWPRTDPNMTDEQYLDELTRYHFSIQHHSTRLNGDGVGRMEISFSNFIKGWYPDAADVLEHTSSTRQMVAGALDAKWRGK